MALLNSNKPNTLANHVGSASAISDLLGTTFCASVFGKGMCWILDTEATNHMICSPNLLTTNSQVTNRTMHLPNGAVAVVTHTGSIRFDDFALHDVLCIPSFKLNLISIIKLVQSSHCLDIFTDDVCMLQDQ